MQGQVPNIPKPRLCALLRDLVAPALLARCESLGIGVSGCCMMQTDDAGRLRLQRWRSSYTPARARRCHRGGAVPARPGPGKFALKKKQSATLPSSYASRPRTWWSSSMAPDRWQATYTRIDAMEYRPKTAGPPPPPAVLQGVPGSGGRSPVRKGYGSRPTSQTRKQAAVPPEAPVPGMQQGKRFRCTCQCITPNAPPQAPRRPNGQRTWSSLRCRPLVG